MRKLLVFMLILCVILVGCKKQPIDEITPIILQEEQVPLDGDVAETEDTITQEQEEIEENVDGLQEDAEALEDVENATGAAKDYRIKITDREGFKPENLTIKVGDTVVIENTGRRTYQLGDNHKLWSAILKSNETFSYTYTTSGVYQYRDIRIGIRGNVIVE